MDQQSHIVSLKKTPAPNSPPSRGGVHWLRIMVLVLVLALLGGGAWYFFVRESNDAVIAAPQDEQISEEITDIIERVGLLIDLPKGEVPTVATISDPEKLRDQPFFANAKVGDKVLLYTQARKAYLYDPERNKLIEVAPITAGTE